MQWFNGLVQCLMAPCNWLKLCAILIAPCNGLMAPSMFDSFVQWFDYSESSNYCIVPSHHSRCHMMASCNSVLAWCKMMMAPWYLLQYCAYFAAWSLCIFSRTLFDVKGGEGFLPLPSFLWRWRLPVWSLLHHRTMV